MYSLDKPAFARRELLSQAALVILSDFISQVSPLSPESKKSNKDQESKSVSQRSLIEARGKSGEKVVPSIKLHPFDC